MRKLIPLLLTALLAISCSALRTPAQLNRFVNRTERRADHYSLNRWKANTARYEKLIKKYIRNYGKYNRNEKRVAMKAIGRYHALLVEHGLRSSIGVATDLKDYAGGLKDIFDKDINAFKDFLKDVMGMNKGQIDELSKKFAEQ